MSTVRFDDWYTTAGIKRGTVLQTVQRIKTDTFTGVTGGGANWINTDMAPTITLSSPTNKVLIMCSLMLASGYWELQGRFTRNGTVIGVGKRNSSTLQCGFHCSHYMNNYQDFWYPTTYTFLDSPNTTSLLTYQLQLNGYSTNNVYINKIEADWDNADYAGTPISTITLMEIQG